MESTQIFGMLAFLFIICLSAFQRVSAITWTITIGISLLLLSYLGILPTTFTYIACVVYLLATVFANISVIRQRFILKPLLPLLKKQLPAISATEREAIEAGHTWWEKDLFGGTPHWDKLFQVPQPKLTTDEQAFLDQQVETLCSMLNDWQVVYEDKDLPKVVWDYLKAEKFFGLVIPKEYGGHGFSALAHSTIVMKIATRSISTAVNTMVPNSLGPAELLLHYGTDEQKNYYLPRLANGTEIPCFALTAPEAGSDAGSIPDVGVVCRGQFEGKEVIGIRLSWDKRYITLAPIATVLGLAFKLYDPDLLIGTEKDIGITLCLIPTSHQGVEIGNRHFPLQLAFMNGPTRGNDVFIPMDWIIGGEKMLGQGWRMLMECLSIGRSISLPALSTACGKATYRYTGAYAKIRKQFNTPIAAFEGIEEALGYIAGNTYTMEAARIMTAGAVDQKVKPAIASAIAKYHMTEMSRNVVTHAMDIHAGHMIQVGPRNFLANVYFSIPISITVEGANILTRNLIIFGQGAIRCHPYLLKEVEYISSQHTDIKALDRVIMSHIGFYISTIVRNMAFGLTGGKLIGTNFKNRRINRYQKQLTRMSAALALLADTSLILLGGSLKRRERLSARLGDILSQLYLGSAVLKYYVDNNKPVSDVDYVCWSLEQCLYKIQVACDDLIKNFPKKWVAQLLRFIIFPFGRAYQMPSDRLCKNIVSPMLDPSTFRDRLTQYCYMSSNDTDTTYRLEKALSMTSMIEPIWKKIMQAIKAKRFIRQHTITDNINLAKSNGVITEDEAKTLHQFEQLRQEVIKVNEFNFDLTQVIA